MSISLRVAATDLNPVGASTFCAIARPVGLEDGDLMLVGLSLPGGVGTTVTAPAGWERVLRTDSTTTVSCAVYWKRAQSEPPTWVWVLSGSVQVTGAFVAYSGVDGFTPIDNAQGTSDAAGGSHGIAGISTSRNGEMLVTFLAAATAATYTAPTDYAERATKTQADSTISAMDRTIATAGQVAATGAAVSMVTEGASVTLALYPSRGTKTIGDVRQVLMDLFPPGAGNLYDFDPGGDAYNLIAAIADGLKLYGYDLADILRTEIDPATAVNNLARWEAVLGLGQSWITRFGTVPQRQAQIVARLRESGSFSRENIKAILGPILGYADPSQLEIVECDRAQLTIAHEYDVPSAAIPGPGSYLQNITVRDQAEVSAAGAQVTMVITHATPADLEVVLQTPNAVAETLSAPFGTAALVGATRVLYFRTLAGEDCGGTWQLAVNNSGGNAGTVDAGGVLFVEGIGYDGGNEGLGRAIFQWAVLVDPTLAGVTHPADYPTARQVLERIKPAHTQVWLVLKNDAGGDAGIWGNPTNSTWDGCLWE